MRMACVPIRDFFCKLCKWISSDKKGTVFKFWWCYQKYDRLNVLQKYIWVRPTVVQKTI